MSEKFTLAYQLKELNVSGKQAREISRRIQQSYDESWRHHHNYLHILDMLKTASREAADWLDEADIPALFWAIIFNDIVYIPSREDNEESSVRVMKTIMAKFKRNRIFFWRSNNKLDELIGRVEQLIMLTKTHKYSDHDRVGQMLVYCDMRILAQPKDIYEAYAANIEKEYYHLSPEAFNKGRIEWLEKTLERGKTEPILPFKLDTDGNEKLNMTDELHRRKQLVR